MYQGEAAVIEANIPQNAKPREPEEIEETAPNIEPEARKLSEGGGLDPESVAIAFWEVGLSSSPTLTEEEIKPTLAPELAEVIEDKTSRNEQILHRLISIDQSYQSLGSRGGRR